MTKILNTWRSNNIEKVYFNEDEPVYKNGDYAVYKQGDKIYLYAYKNIALNQLCALNKDHIDRVASRTRPEGKYSPQTFLYDRSIESLERGMKLL